MRWRALPVALGATVLGLGLGLLAGRSTIYLLLLCIGGLVPVAGWWLFRRPQLTVAVFWFAFVLQNTLFAGFQVQGLYYPIYGLMAFNAVWMLATQQAAVPWRSLVPYALFYVIVLFSLFRVATALDFDLLQRLFIYAMGFLTLFQFSSQRSLGALNRAQVVAGLIVAGWVIFNAVRVGFEDRSGIEVNQNDVATILSIGLLPLLASMLSSRGLEGRRRYLGLFACLAFGGYALLLLASRGVTVALVMAVLVMLARVARDPRKSLPLLLTAGLAAVVLLNLPGSDNLVARFTAEDVASANGRLPLWQAAGSALLDSSPFELLLGHGLDFSRVVVASVTGFLDSVHNAYLQMVLEFGVVGLVLFLSIHVAAIAMLLPFKDRVSLYALGAVVLLLFANLTATDPDKFLYWVVLGHALATGAWKRTGRVRGRLPTFG